MNWGPANDNDVPETKRFQIIVLWQVICYFQLGNTIRTPLNLFNLPEPEEHERFLIDDVCCKNTQSILVFNCSWRTILMESTFCNLHYNQLFITILEREFAKTIQPDIFNCYLPLGTLSTLGLPFPQWAIHWSLRRLCHMY